MTVMIVDGFDMVLEGLGAMMRSEEDFEVVALARNEDEAQRYTRGHKPALAILGPNLTPDFASTSQPEVVRAIRGVSKDTRILLLTRSEAEIPIVSESLQEGADGAIMLSAPKEELLDACYQVFEGSGYFTPRLAREMLRSKNVAAQHPLTERELNVLEGVSFGYTNGEIAKNLHLSVRTVEAHRASIMEKVGIKSRAEMVHYAIQLGLLEGYDPYWHQEPIPF